MKIDRKRLLRPIEYDSELRRLDMLYRGSVTGPIAIAVSTAAYLYISWGARERAFLIVWYSVMNLVAGARIVLNWRWNLAKYHLETVKDLKRWQGYIVLSLLLTGLGWGLMGWMSVGSDNVVRESLVGLMIFGMTAGALASFAPSLSCMYAMLLPSMVPWIARMLLSHREEYFILSILCTLYTCAMLFLARNFNSYVKRGLRLNSELTASEERLRLARDASGGMTWEWDLASGRLNCEGNIELFFELSNRSFTGTIDDYLQRVHPEDLARLKNLFSEAKHFPAADLDTEHRTIWSKGNIHHVAVRGKIFFDDKKQPVRVRGICWDITSKKSEQNMRIERDIFAAASKAKLVFLANASHEIRTPLAAINGFAESLLVRPLLADVREDVNVILRNGKYLVSVVNDLLDLSKSETDRIYIQKAGFSPVREIYDSLLLVKSTATRKGLAIELEFESMMPEFIKSDATRFRQILINLLANAVKFTEAGKITLLVKCTRTDPEQGILQIRVRDTGWGMSESTQANLFEPFARGESQAVQRLPGSGLGLALSRSLARRMGGDLTLLQTTIGEGSVFAMHIETGDLNEVRWDAGETLAREPLEPSANAALNDPVHRLEGTRILIVEDDPDLSELMQRYLKQQGAIVETCDNGADAVTRALAANFHVVLMDIKMPVMDGYQATSLLREKGYRQSIVALTAHASSDDQQMCYQAGCDSYLSKPVDTEHLIEILTKQRHAHG